MNRNRVNCFFIPNSHDMFAKPRPFRRECFDNVRALGLKSASVL